MKVENISELIQELLDNHSYTTLGMHLAMCFQEQETLDYLTNKEFEEMLVKYISELEMFGDMQNTSEIDYFEGEEDFFDE